MPLFFVKYHHCWCFDMTNLMNTDDLIFNIMIWNLLGYMSRMDKIWRGEWHLGWLWPCCKKGMLLSECFFVSSVHLAFCWMWIMNYLSWFCIINLCMWVNASSIGHLHMNHLFWWTPSKRESHTICHTNYTLIAMRTP